MVAAFRHGLREAGFTEGQNVAIEYRWAEGTMTDYQGWRPSWRPALGADPALGAADARVPNRRTIGYEIASEFQSSNLEVSVSPRCCADNHSFGHRSFSSGWVK